ncbi:MAG: PDZ domain-containing protein [Saprospiraceae bacterium]|nr:PDZ domain-containing protein [Saprospiraceae bacterium]
MKNQLPRISLFVCLCLFLYTDCLAQRSMIGVGISLVDANAGQPDNYPWIKRVMARSPAEEAGFKPGDIIWSIDGEDLNGWAAKKVSSLIAGDSGVVRTFVLGADKRKVAVALRQITGNCIEGDCQNGTGRMEEVNGCIYQGSFFNGKFDGNGEYWHVEQDKVNFYYKGQMVEGKFEGVGKLVSLQNDYRYEGFFRGGTVSGKARVTYVKIKTFYEGYFFQGNPLGPGTMTYPTGETRQINPKSWVDLRKATGQEKKSDHAQRKSWTEFNHQMQETEAVLLELAEKYKQFHQKHQEATQKFSSAYVIETYTSGSFQQYIQTLDKADTLFDACHQAFFDTNFTTQQVAGAESWLEILTPVMAAITAKESNGLRSMSTVVLQHNGTEWLQESVLKARGVRRM